MSRFIHLPEVDSTSRHMRRLADDPAGGLEAWTVVVADRQTAGYGQQGRSWQSPDAGLYTSIFLGPEVVSPVFTLLAGVAAIRACREMTGAGGLGLKWVNDLVWSGRKIGGILTEVCHRKWLIVGIGINLQPVAVAEAASLAEAAGPGHTVDRMALLAALVGRLQQGIALWQAEGNRAVVEAWVQDSVTIGKDVRVETAGETVCGRAIGLDSDGRLILETPGGACRLVASGSVRLSNGSYA